MMTSLSFRQKFIISGALLLPTLGTAATYKDTGISYSVEPIVGYELQRRDNPDRVRHGLTYGARVIAGWKIISAEGEYTIGNTDETFLTTNTQVKEKSEKARLGLRSTYGLGSILDWYLRGGGEAQRIQTTRTVSGVSTETRSDPHVFPYVGTGLSVQLANNFALDASVLATVKDVKDLNRNEYSTTFGLRISVNSGR